MPAVRILNSWKEISNYIGRGVRTVQRWEEMYQLPVHRPASRDRSAVYAIADEIDAWLRAGKMHGSVGLAPQSGDGVGEWLDRAALLKRIAALESEVRELRKQVAGLRRPDLKRIRELRAG
jgi:hypothetical protein